MNDRCGKAAETAVRLLCYYLIVKGIVGAAIMIFVFWP
jgi:hypothetical protein